MAIAFAIARVIVSGFLIVIDMKKIFVFLVAILLAGCAHDNYVVLPGSEGSKEAMPKDLRECGHQIIHEYFSQAKPAVTGDQIVGLVASSVVGGAIGGAAFGAVMNQDEEGYAIKRKDLDSLVEDCMYDRGYELVGK